MTYTVEDEISRVVGSMESMKPDTKEYGVAAQNLRVLAEVKQAITPPAPKVEEKKPRFTISGDAVIAAVVNIAGLLLVLNYEQLNVISSKAFNRVKF